MKMQPDKFDVQSIAASGEGWIGVATPGGGQRFHESFAVGSRGELQTWGCNRFEDLNVEHFNALAALNPELVVFGSGHKLRFPKPALLRSLIDAGIGVETMDTAAACRTYNILAQEGRHVVAGLLLET
jgi:uncharacterized protein